MQSEVAECRIMKIKLMNEIQEQLEVGNTWEFAAINPSHPGPIPMSDTRHAKE